MQRRLLLILLTTLSIVAADDCNGQQPSISDYLPMRKYKVNLLIDTVTGKIYDIRTIDSIGNAGTPIVLARDSISHDTAYWMFFFAKPFVQEETGLYRKMMDQPFPSFTLSNSIGQWVSKYNISGKIALINFWSTTCGPCVAEIPDLNRLADSLRKGPFVFIAPALDNQPEVEKFLLSHPFKYIVFPGASSFADKLGVRNYPTHVIIDGSGKVVAIFEGVNVDPVTHKPLIREEIDSVLKRLTKPNG